MPTLKDVAALAGVTVTTVSRMLNNSAPVSAKTRAKIEAAMQALDYQPNELAQSLTRQKSHFIGLIVPSARHFYFARLIDYIERYVWQAGYKLLLCISDLELQKEIEYFNMLKSNRAAGIIIASHTPQLLEHISFKAPLITLERKLAQDIPAVTADNYNAGRLAGEHLISRGCRQLLYFSGSRKLEMEANKRYAGLSDVCLEHGLAVPGLIDADERAFIAMDYRELIAELFRARAETDGIFCSNDIIAAQILQYCRAQGIEVPQRLRLLGCDDTDLASLTIPRLSSIRQPLEAICAAAVRSLVAAAEGETIPSDTVFPVELIVRESS